MTDDIKHDSTDVSVSTNDASREAEVQATIPPHIIKNYREKALTQLARTAELPGFRKGTAPRDIVAKHVGEPALLKEAVEDAVREEIPKLFAAHQLIAIAPPAVIIEPPAPEQPVKFTAKAPLFPTIELPDYAQIAAKHPAPEGPWDATDEELQDALTHLRRERMRIEAVNDGMEPAQAAEEAKKADTLSLPPLDDAFAISVGFKDAEDFKASVKKNIAGEKERAAFEKRRAELIDEIVSGAKIAMPAIMKEWELDEIESEFKHDIERMGATWEGYLSYAKKTRDEARSAWIETAEKRAKIRLALDTIAAKEGIEPPAETVEKEVKHMQEHYPDALEENLRSYITRSLRTQMTLHFLETGSKELPPQPGHDHDHREHEDRESAE